MWTKNSGFKIGVEPSTSLLIAYSVDDCTKYRVVALDRDAEINIFFNTIYVKKFRFQKLIEKIYEIKHTKNDSYLVLKNKFKNINNILIIR